MATTINIILSILSFLLALISVITVIITLKQNGKMLKQNDRQLKEMQKEHRLSLQPVLKLSEPLFMITKPSIVFKPWDNKVVIQSNYGFKIDVENISEYVAVNAIFYSSYIALEGEKDDDIGFATLESRNIILKEKDVVDFVYVEDCKGSVVKSLLEQSPARRPNILVGCSYKNTAGGYFRTINRYIVKANEEEEIVNKWFSLIEHLNSKYKDELKILAENHDNKIIIDDINSEIDSVVGNKEMIIFECVEIPEGFTYETISKEEYDFVNKGIRHPVYAGSEVKKYRVRTSSPFVKNSSVEKSNL